jgi:uncharacterized protein (TIGR00661 family)
VRIAYGIHGYGRGHATRTLALLPELARRHDLLILAGGEAHAAIWPDFPVLRIPTLGYHYGRAAKRSNWRTLRGNFSRVLDLLLRGPAYQMVLEAVRDFRPDVVISDAEAWSHRAARHLGIPRIGFDHFGILAYCKPPMPWRDRLLSRRDVLVYRALMGQPQRVLISSFYEAPPQRPGVHIVGPILRPELHRLQATRGAYLLAYFNNGAHQLTCDVEQALRSAGRRVVVYGTARQGVQGNLEFRSPSNLPFLEHLAGCRAVITTAGNQLVGEALHLRKPLLVFPEDCVEQRLNAAAVERMGIGMRLDLKRLTADVINEFLAREEGYRAAAERWARDGRHQALDAIERFLCELAATPRSPDREADCGALAAS